MFDELNIYKHHDHFFFERGMKLSEVGNAPEKPGVYLIYQLRKDKVQLVYIGASGTINRKGEFSNQLLKGRLMKGKQNGSSRQDYFQQMMLRDDIDALDIYWWVTYDEHTKHLPMYVEGVLLQKYFEMNGCLPLWNKEF